MNNNLEKILDGQPRFRREQIYKAWFDPKIKSLSEITTLPKEWREKQKDFIWVPFQLVSIQESSLDETKKALLKLSDGEMIETVLMGRQSKKIEQSSDRRYTICLSSQVGCPLKCSFCATGSMGFKRNLTADEIVGQYRFWNYFLNERGKGAVSNIVLMGQGEPLLNYEAVKNAINIFLKYTDVGPSKITLSTSGVIPGMERMVEDQDFPGVRFALSLHSAIESDRKELMPSQPPDFFTFLTSWSKKYHRRWPSRTHFIGLEYIFINNINDSDKHLKALIKLASKLGRVRLNLIPYNVYGGKESSSPYEKLKEWQNKLMNSGFTVTIRLSQGSDIAAACGQLRNIKV